MRLYFAERPSSCRLDVFTLDGMRVGSVETGPGGQPVFDPGKLASGIYIVAVETHFDSGRYERFRSKVAVLR